MKKSARNVLVRFGLVVLMASLSSWASGWHDAGAKWKRVLEEKAPAEDHLAARDALARRQAVAAIALLRSGRTESVWPLLQHSPDPSLRSYLIRDIGRSGVKPDLLVRRLEIEMDVSVRQALILSLGAFTEDELPPSKGNALIPRLLRLYRDDPDAGVHSAIDWLLRHGRQGLMDRPLDWKQGIGLRVIDEELAGRPPGGRNWFVTKEGHTLAMLRGPIEFTMGAPTYEPGRNKSPEEALHRVRIPRSFAVATKEVTVARFQRFLEANPAIKKAAQAAGARDPSKGGRMLSRSSPNTLHLRILIREATLR